MLVILLILYIFMQSPSEALKLVGPEAPLVAVAGDDLVLPCFIQPKTSAADITVEWYKLYVQDSLVHLYRDHEDRNEKQAQPYRGRTSVFKDQLQKGNASLKFSALQVSDEGEYKCLVVDKSWSDEITIQVIVEVLGGHPVITLESYDNSGGINLVCESRGWKPEPQVLWLDREGVTLTAEDTQIHNDTEGFSVKRRVTVYDYSDSNRYYCRVKQKHHIMDAKVIINNKIFAVWKWAVGASVSVCLIAVGLITAAIVYYKKELQLQRDKLQLQRDDLLKKKKFAVDVTLDPDTAHPNLILTDGKQVTCGDKSQNVSDNPKRFTTGIDVLGCQGFSTGRFYFEVQVREKTKWTLGIVAESIERKGSVNLKPGSKAWTVALRNGKEYKAYDGPPANPSVPIMLRKKVEIVGVFVDYEEGLVSFFDAEASSHIYSFTSQKFTENLYPFFSPESNEGGKNVAPLIICPLINAERYFTSKIYTTESMKRKGNLKSVSGKSTQIVLDV